MHRGKHIPSRPRLKHNGRQTATLLSKLAGVLILSTPPPHTPCSPLPASPHHPTQCKLHKIHRQTTSQCYSKSNAMTIPCSCSSTAARSQLRCKEILSPLPIAPQLSYLLPGAPTCTDLLHHSWMTRIAPGIRNQFCHLLLVSAISSLLFWPSGLDLEKINPSYKMPQGVAEYLSHETHMEYSSSFSRSLFPWWQVYPQHVLFNTRMQFRESLMT